MNELDYRRRISQLPRERQPQRDLWVGIADRIATRKMPQHRSRLGWAAAAMLVVGLGLLPWLREQVPTPAGPVATRPSVEQSTRMARAALAAEFDGALREFSDGRPAQLGDLVGGDVALSAAAHELSSAQREIDDMLAQRPDAHFLIGMLKRNQQQQLRLARRSAQFT